MNMNGFADATAFDASYMFNNNNNNNPQFQNAQYQQQQAALQQQQQRSQTPQFPYSVNPVVPSKRPREDGVAASPRQTPSNINLSRSQTPQQAGYPVGFPGSQQGQQLQAPNPYQHLQQQHGSANATPSPTLSNQQFRPPTQQRNSPNPHFPQAQQQQSGLGTPDANGRVGTPQNAQFMAGQMNNPMGGQMMPSQIGGGNFMPSQQPMPQGYNNQNFGGGGGGMPNMSGGQMPYSAAQVQLTPNLAQQQAEAHRLYRLKQMQQQQQMQQNRARQQQQTAAMNPMMAGQHPNMQTPTRPQVQPSGNMQGQQMQNQQQRMMEEQKFLQNVHKFMTGGGRQFNPQPVVQGRPISLFALFTLVMRAKGSKRITMGNQWTQVAQRMNYAPEQYPSAAMEIKDIFEKNLGPWEAATYANAAAQQKMKFDQMQQQQMGGMPQGQAMSPDRPVPETPQNTQATQQYMQQLQQRMNVVQQQQQHTPQQMTPVQNNASLPGTNGWATPQTDPAVVRPQTALDQHRKSASYKLEGSPAPAKPTFATPPPGKLAERSESAARMTNGAPKILKIGGPEQEETTNHEPRWKFLEDSWGGVDGVDNRAKEAEKLVNLIPNVPNLEEMGNADIHALTLSLQSGIHAEMRYALDVLVKMTFHRGVFIELDLCEDLIDILLDCAEDQVEILAEEAPEVSDILDLGSYEEVLRNVKIEVHGLQDIPEVGTLAWQLDRAADRLIAITTILRNLSDPSRYSDKNLYLLATSKPVIKFLSSTIRLLGTRNMFFRSYVNAQDFMKDVVIILSNISDKISLPSREDAFNILHFLLSFAPGPSPASTKPLRFSHYNVETHKYYPPAIDSLAKLLARDDPNRTFYKHIFLDNISNSPSVPVYQQYELLTQVFGFAISVLPEKPSNPEVVRTCEARKPILTQGLLAADILSMLVPGAEVGLAKEWLAAEDGWAPSLLRLSALLAARDGQERLKLQMEEARLQQQRGGVVRQPPLVNEDLMFGIVTHRALGMLRRLGTKSVDSNQVPTSKDDDSDSDNEQAKTKKARQTTMDAGSREELDEEWERAIALSGFNGEIIPKQATVMGAVIDISLDQVVLREMIALGDLGG